MTSSAGPAAIAFPPRRPAFHIVLVEPEIPHNAGAAGRLCLATGSRLHLVAPLGFDISDAAVRRVGLDYWRDVDLQVWPSFAAFLQARAPDDRLFALTTKSPRPYHRQSFREGDYLLFGCETRGLPEWFLRESGKRAITIPTQTVRSLNLSTAISAVLFEAMRQTGRLDTLAASRTPAPS